MSKNIVLCLDGTWNGPNSTNRTGTLTPTNVQKLFENLKGSGPLGPDDNEREIAFAEGTGEARQVAKYIHGVGDDSNVLARMAGGSMGLGLVARIVRGYTYLSRQYQPGDQIYIAGFSRGAYTARALAGFVTHKGLLDWKAMQLEAGSEASYSAGLSAWQQYKETVHAGAPNLLHALANSITALYDRVELGLHPPPALQLVADIRIAAVGVWDTVGALGIPSLHAEDGTLVRLDEFRFCNNDLSERVANGFQALAVDEQRVDFTPTLWNARVGVVQVLFPGAHADVGGGYAPAESGLSNGALIWMTNRLASAGVLFERMPPWQPNACDVAHRPWAGSIYAVAPREFPPALGLSQRVIQRLAAQTVPVEGLEPERYRPANLLNSYLRLDGTGPAPHVQIEP
ncbi:DUF2235 domain-containing protein [Paraburkholderia lycopersici]|uniref:Uncharacterized alpha/beta hydrolase domain n=1 Tax=Paraburkholderia lycopersici TaxID=416944 RepID=A0A1G6PZN9_9BURK|nr:DUF2235 domain-containing protein [Paraburkholderia lycopersici]SDC85431.1 Uncharacterized alpha/beta hydrolase domain [Paraburkholderia lycopersici]